MTLQQLHQEMVRVLRIMADIKVSSNPLVAQDECMALGYIFGEDNPEIWRKKVDPDDGICYLLEILFMDATIDDRSAENCVVRARDEAIGAYLVSKGGRAERWRMSYPVKHPTLPSNKAYDEGEVFWGDDEYGDNRRELAAFMADFIEEKYL